MAVNYNGGDVSGKVLKTTVYTDLLSASPGGDTYCEINLIQDSVFADKTYIPVAITSISIDQGKCALEGFGIRPKGTNGYTLFVNCYNPRNTSVEFYLEAIILWAKAPMLTS